MKIVKEFILREIAGECVLVPTGVTSQEFNGMITISDTAKFIWENIEKVDSLEEMIQMAEKLAEGIPFVRVDLYQADGKIYFGEMTFTPATGVLFHFKDTFLEEEGKYCVTENKRCGYEKDSSGRGRVRRSC